MGDAEHDIEADALEAAAVVGADGRRRVKRKMALVIGYIGTRYRGLVINHEVEAIADKKSVEAVLRDALVRASMVTALNAERLEQKIGWSRSSRTDAGVHALRLVVAGKLLLVEDDIDETGHCAPLAAELNRHLPEDIRCFGAVKVTKSFDAKGACSWREYAYLIPSRLLRRTEGDEATPPEELAHRLEHAMQLFVGCHSFHNFTRLKAADLAWRTPAESQDIRQPERGHMQKGKGKGKSTGRKGRNRGKKRKGAPTATAAPGVVGDEAVDAGADDAMSGPDDGCAATGNGCVASGPELGDGGAAEGAEVGDSRAAAEPELGDGCTAAGPELGDGCEAAELELGASHPAAEPELGDSCPASALDLGEGQEPAAAAASAREQRTHPEPPWVEICVRDRGAWRVRSEEVMKHTLSTIYMCTVEPTRAGQMLSVRLRGQFFLYNQIRLMIGSAIAICVEVLQEELVRMALTIKVEMHLPIAPAVGLFQRSAGFSEMDRRAGFCAMDGTQARDCMLPESGFVLLDEEAAVAAQLFEERVEAEIEVQWAQCGAAEAWQAKLHGVRAPTGALLDELRAEHVALSTRELEMRESQAAADLKRREARLATGGGSFVGLMPRRFAADLMVRFRLLPGWRLTNVQHALSVRMRRWQQEPGERPAEIHSWPAGTGELLDYVAQVGADVLADEGARSA